MEKKTTKKNELCIFNWKKFPWTIKKTATLNKLLVLIRKKQRKVGKGG
jgi:hypothetical protein